MIKAIVFDFDGVIVDSFDEVYEIYLMLADKKRKKFMTKEKFRKCGSTNWQKMLLGMGFGEEDIADISKMFFDEYKKRKDKFKFFDNSAAMIRNLHEKFKLAIVSNGDTRRICEQLKQHDVLDCFQFIIGMEAPKHKPDPYQIIACMKNLGVTPEETSFVGDTREDIIAGKRAHVSRVIATSYGYNLAEMLTSADIVVHSPKELAKILGELQ